MSAGAAFEEAHFAAVLVREAADAIVYADAKGAIRFWNAAAARIFGWTEAEAIGQSLDLIIPETLRQRHWQGFEQTMRSGESRYGGGDLLAVPALRKDGVRISVEFTIVPFRADDGTMTGIGAVMRDVTRQYEAMRALRKQLEQQR